MKSAFGEKKRRRLARLSGLEVWAAYVVDHDTARLLTPRGSSVIVDKRTGQVLRVRFRALDEDQDIREPAR